ncbi:hypothetical protein E4U40_004304 [Claviceps sp. LM458 group G5]|nr:hypothetical protein E4U40_004304 [Claviceps sp. LM458 group G5]
MKDDACSLAAFSFAALLPAALSPAARQLVSSHPPPSHLPVSNPTPSHQLPSTPAMDRRRVDSLALSAASWSADDSRRNLGDEDVHRVMDGAGDHDDHVTQDDAHIVSEQQHHSRFHPNHGSGEGRLTTRRRTAHMSSISARQQSLVKLSGALIMYGTPPHQSEEYMSMSSRALEIEALFFYIPECMAIIFAHSTAGPAEVNLVPVSEGIDLGRQQDIHDILMDVAHDRLRAWCEGSSTAA